MPFGLSTFEVSTFLLITLFELLIDFFHVMWSNKVKRFLSLFYRFYFLLHSQIFYILILNQNISKSLYWKFLFHRWPQCNSDSSCDQSNAFTSSANIVSEPCLLNVMKSFNLYWSATFLLIFLLELYLQNTVTVT